MKMCLILCFLVCVSAFHKEVIKAQWERYKAQHGKKYHHSVEADHLKHFLQSTITIETHNAHYHRGEVGYKLGHNRFSDFSPEDVKRKLFGKRRMDIEGYNLTEIPPMDVAALPETVDWRNKKIITSVKDQGDCGSCYSFAAVAVVESAIAQETQTRLDLSEQQTIDCTFKMDGAVNDSCDGGHEVVILNYISKCGITSESNYFYISGVDGVRRTCRRGKRIAKWGKDLKIRRVPKMNEDELAKAVATFGPLIVSMAGENNDFKHYRGGIYDHASCSKDTNHVAVLVGYGTQGGRRYWLIKNSWGTRWGNKGYGKLLRGVNQCGIVSEDAYSVYF